MLMSRIQLYISADPSTKLGDIHWYRGDSFPIKLLAKKNGVPLDLTGASFLLTVSSASDPVDATTKIFGVTGVIDPEQAANMGELSFTPLSANTNLESKQYYYDVQLVLDGYVRTIAKANFNILQDITKESGGDAGWDAIPDWDATP